jgi:hypothetical protein
MTTPNRIARNGAAINFIAAGERFSMNGIANTPPAIKASTSAIALPFSKSNTTQPLPDRAAIKLLTTVIAMMAKIAKAKTDVYGTRFESKCLFADPTDHNIVYKKDPSRILYKVSDNVLSADEIQDIMYRFNLTAFSKEFWTTSNIIDHFEQNYTIGYDEGRPYTVVTDDGKGFFVKKVAQKLEHTGRRWYYKIAGYYTYCRFDRDMSDEIINDYQKMSAGRALADYYYCDEYNYYFHMYPGLTREGINAMFESLEPAPDPSSVHSWKYPAIEYITKEGYRSKSLDKYIYMVHVSKEQPSKFTLPTLEK